MKSFPSNFTAHWGGFAQSHPQLAEQLHDTALLFCEAMTSDAPVDQIEKMRETEGFEDLRKTVLTFKDELGLDDCSDRELALWLRTICFCSTMSAEQVPI